MVALSLVVSRASRARNSRSAGPLGPHLSQNKAVRPTEWTMDRFDPGNYPTVFEPRTVHKHCPRFVSNVGCEPRPPPHLLLAPLTPATPLSRLWTRDNSTEEAGDARWLGCIDEGEGWPSGASHVHGHACGIYHHDAITLVLVGASRRYAKDGDSRHGNHAARGETFKAQDADRGLGVVDGVYVLVYPRF